MVMIEDDGARLELVTPTLDLADVCRECEASFAAQGEVFLGERTQDWPAQDWPAFVRWCEDDAAGRLLATHPERVPQTTYILLRAALDGSRVALGTSRLRHHLNPALEDAGGHIGYAIRPDERGKGYGNRILALTLPRARALGLSRVLVTCATDNARSARVIMANGGILTSEGMSVQTGSRHSRYWIAL
jgi:predicted acetyltransferase